MSKVYLNYGQIESVCFPAIDNVVDSLSNVITLLEQVSIPLDFSKRTTLINTISNLKTCKTSLVNTKTWIYNSNKNYDSMIDKLYLQASLLPDYQVKKRNSIMNYFA